MSRRDERKAKVRAWGDARACEQAVTTPRSPRDEIWYPGLGARLVGLLALPSFDPAQSRDVRVDSPGSKSLAVFTSRGTPPAESSEPMLVGYQPLDTSGLDLIELMKRLETVRVPVLLSEWLSDGPVLGILDGTRYELITPGTGSSRCVSWTEEGPEACRELTNFAREPIRIFEELRPLDA